MKRWAKLAVLVALVVPLWGCDAFEHGWTTMDYAQRCLPSSSEAYAKRLAMESSFDPTVRGFVEDHGPPDYLYVVDEDEVHFMYTSRDLAATFTRRWTADSVVTTYDSIPDELFALLPRDEREGLAANGL